MKIKLLQSAIQDLIDGHAFYEKQSPGVGEYFLDSLYSDIDTLLITAGIHPITFSLFQSTLVQTISICGVLHHKQTNYLCLCRTGLEENRLGLDKLMQIEFNF